MDFVIVVESETKHEAGSYPYKFVIAKRAKSPCPDLPFVTWMAVERDGKLDMAHGHYDLSLTTACIDFQERCKGYHIGLGNMYGTALKLRS